MILPLNSILDPILYTPLFKKVLKLWYGDSGRRGRRLKVRVIKRIPAPAELEQALGDDETTRQEEEIADGRLADDNIDNNDVNDIDNETVGQSDETVEECEECERRADDNVTSASGQLDGIATERRLDVEVELKTDRIGTTAM